MGEDPKDITQLDEGLPALAESQAPGLQLPETPNVLSVAEVWGQGFLLCQSPAEGLGTDDVATENDHPVCRIQAQAGEQGGCKSQNHC